MLCLAITIATLTAWCQEPPKPEPVTITVFGTPVPVSAQAASVTVLDRQFIEDSRSTSVADVLRYAPFLYVSQAGPGGALTTATIRAGKPNFTVVLMDGVPLNDLSNSLGGSYDLSSLSTDNVERIEIVRGALSSAYGSEAVAGVINIVSRRGEGPPIVEARADGGSFGTAEGALAISGRSGRFSYAASGSYQSVDTQVLNDAHSLATAAAHLDIAAGRDGVLQFTMRYQNNLSYGFPPNGGGPEYSILRSPAVNHAGEETGAVSYRKQVNKQWSFAAEFGVFDRNQTANIPAIEDKSPPTLASVPSESGMAGFNRLRSSFSATVKLPKGFTFIGHVTDTREHGSNDYLLAGFLKSAFQLTRNSLQGGGDLLYEGARWNASGSLGVNYTPSFGTVASPRMGASVRLNSAGSRIKGSWGEGFNLPSFYALGDPNVGNKTLRMERSKSLDVGIEQPFGKSSVSLSYFHDRYTDLVDFSTTLFKLINRSNTIAQGAEFGVSSKLGRAITIGAQAAYTTWQIENTTDPLRDQPHWRTGVNLEWRPMSRLFVRADSLWVGRRYDFQVPVPAMKSVGGYATSSLVCSYRLTESVDAFFRADNLFDSHYHEFVGFPSAGTYARVGLAFRLKMR
jgi:vitamin B12 transporter